MPNFENLIHKACKIWQKIPHLAKFLKFGYFAIVGDLSGKNPQIPANLASFMKKTFKINSTQFGKFYAQNFLNLIKTVKFGKICRIW